MWSRGVERVRKETTQIGSVFLYGAYVETAKCGIAGCCDMRITVMRDNLIES